MQDTTSQDSGINEDEVNEETTEETTEDTQTETTEESKDTNKGKSNVPKILAEKNKWKAEAEKWKKEAESKEFNEDKAQNMINAAIAAQKASDFKNKERNNFLETYGEENLEIVEATLKEHDKLTYEQAAMISGIGITQPSNPNKYSFAWNTPASIRKPKTVETISDEELRQWVVAELQNMKLYNAS